MKHSDESTSQNKLWLLNSRLTEAFPSIYWSVIKHQALPEALRMPPQNQGALCPGGIIHAPDLIFMENKVRSLIWGILFITA